MRYFRYPSVLHGGEIHSLDISSNNTRVLTSGADKKVCLWSLEDFTNLANLETPDKTAVSSRNGSSTDHQPQSTKEQKKTSDIKPLMSIDCHDSLTNIVKWSPQSSNQFISVDVSGKLYLHSVEEDSSSHSHSHKLVYPFGKVDPTPIIDLTWSNDGRLVAWSTNDGKVNVLDILRNTFQELTTLTHLDKLTVQRSVAFDPTNNYLITLGDDTLVYLYQYHYEATTNNYQFRLINKISRLISKNPINVNYKRISWSPEGELLSVPTASKNSTSVISLISRSKNWQNRISLVGHGLACEVVRFNPKFLRESDTDNNIYNVIATGGSDRTLAVWNTSKDTPILILQEIVNKPILDIVWDKTGKTLLVASQDGYLSILSVDENELGYDITDEMLQEVKKFEGDYVKPINYKYESDQPTTRRSSNIQIELLDQKDAKSTTDNTDEIIKAEGPTELEDKDIKEVTDNLSPNGTADEKKGPIEPEVISPPNMKEPEVASSDLLHSAMNNRQAKSNAASSLTGPSTTIGKTTTKKTAILTSTTAAATLSADKQTVTTKNGKRRIQPMLISNNGTSGPTTGPSVTSDSGSLGVGAAVSGSSKSIMDFEKPSYSVSEDFYKQNKRIKSQDEAGPVNKKLKRELEPVKFIGSVIVNPNTTFSRVRLAVPKVRLNFQLTSKSDGDVFVLDVKNGTGNETKPSRITYFKKEKQIWCDFIPRYIQLASEGSNFWALSTSDGQILSYSHTSGKRLLPPIVLGSSVSFLESHGKYLMAVTSLGEMFVWDLEKKKVELTTLLSPLLELNNKYQEDGLSKSDNVTLCAVTSTGIPLVTLSNGSGYLYNKDLGIWQTITESWWSFGSHYWESNEENGGKPQTSNFFNEEASIVEYLEHKTNEEIIRKTRTGRGKYFNKISKNMVMKEGFENLENTISISHLENRILCCELLGESKDFRRFFLTYVQRICELGFKAKLFEVCDELLGPSEEDEGDDEVRRASEWKAKVCGIDKHELLKEVVMVCAKHRDAQRILIHFGKKIGVVDEGA
ncbi:histone transcription regulator HIRA, WD repeat superfamily [Scheffersomyces xylosifermentans]|uniref:histone transcription regulator HIRA, WD repeat superfamily n=1 Tax=Scheffersomyces xylosifermentans TaxID=1304137 RepID=UPI00315DDBF7